MRAERKTDNNYRYINQKNTYHIKGNIMTLLFEQLEPAIKTTSFKHGWFYHYRLDVANLDILTKNGLEPLNHYLNHMFEFCPDEPFLEGARSSALKFPVTVDMVENKTHEVCTQAKDGLEILKDRFKSAHSKVQLFMLENDPKTISCEVPLWLEPIEMQGLQNHFDVGLPLSGHIDVLQIKDEKIIVLDYKPKAHKEKYASTQVYFYAKMLSARTGIPIEKFYCGYFDSDTSFWFDPKDVRF
ncbi:Dna2/Cas4 domain-containing protein [archaeon]|nr:Dna2/Cas4 domain-containing protein [archaeon]